MFDGNVFPISGTAQPVDHFKINYADYLLDFYRPEGDIETNLVFEYIVPGTGQSTPVSERTIIIDKSVTTRENLIDWLLNHRELGILDNLTRLRSEAYFLPAIFVPPDQVPDNLPAGSVDDSYWEVPSRSDTFRLGLNVTDHDILWGIDGDRILIRRVPPEFLSLYMETGSTTENEWWIGDIFTGENPKVGHITLEITRSEE